MAWTTPRTWTTSELVTASIMNTHVRDNLNYLYGGKEELYISAEAMTPAETSGCAALATTELTSGNPNINYLAFDPSADEYAQIGIVFPKKWGLGTITFQVDWYASDANATGVAWALQGVAVGDGEDMDVAYGTPVVVTDTQQSNQYDHLYTAESGPVTIAGTPADGDKISLQIFRDVSDAADNLATDAWLAGITIYYTTDQHFAA